MKCWRASAPLLLVLMLAAGPVSAQKTASTGSGLLTPRDSTETFVDRVPVSSVGIRVGIMTVEAAPVAMPGTISVPLAGTTANTLCISVTSRDGRYRANYSYDIRSAGTGTLRVRTPTQYPEQLRKYQQGDLAILASAGASCETAPASFLVASWGATASSASVAVLLNSRVPTTLIIGRGNVIDRTVPCVTVEGERTAFNLRCDVQLAWLTRESRLFIRQRSGESVKQLPIPLALP